MVSSPIVRTTVSLKLIDFLALNASTRGFPGILPRMGKSDAASDRVPLPFSQGRAEGYPASPEAVRDLAFA